MAKCDEGYLCDVCGQDVAELTDSEMYLRYIVGMLDPEVLHTTPERHIRCNPSLAQYIVADDFPPVVVEGPFDKRTLDRLHAMTVTPSHEELFNIEPKPGALDPRCRTGRVLCIDKTSRTLRWVIDGKVQLTLDARFGSTVNDTPTREGLFHVYFMNADHVSKLYGSEMPYAMFFSGGQAVHYSSDFASVGYYGASHGCVNIRDYEGVKWLFSQVRVGDTVVVYWS
jgi:hypothetical protein